MLPVEQVPFDDRLEVRVMQVTIEKSCNEGAIPRDSNGEDDPVRTENATGRTQGFLAIVGIGDVIQGTQKQHGVARRIRCV